MKLDRRYTPSKKASRVRGFMNVDEIKDHLHGKTPEQQINYLEKIKTKKSMLAEQTRHHVNRILDGLYEKEISTASMSDYRTHLTYPTTKISRVEAANTNHISYLNGRRAELAEEEGEYGSAIRLYGEVMYDKNRLLAMSDYKNHRTLMDEEKDLERKIEQLSSKNQRQKRQKIDAPVIKRLEGRLPVVISLISMAGLFFLSSNITGNVVSNLQSETVSFMEVSLLLIGLISGLFWFRNQKL